MKALVAAVVLVASAIGLSSAVGAAGSPGRPPGVAAKDWIPITDSLGIVVLHRDDRIVYSNNPLPELLRPVLGADGYFMVRDHGDWRRLIVTRLPADRIAPNGS